MKLTPLVISDVVNTPLPEVQVLDFSKKEVNHIEDISCCVGLRKLNLSQNTIKAANALSGIQYNSELTWLNLSGNQLESFEGLERLKKLSVLNLSHNKINRISQHVTSLVSLKALILNHNSIKRVENIGGLHELNTIVLSHNKLEELPSFPTLAKLTKFSAAHNELRSVPDFSLNPELKELRLNDNKITAIPESLRGCSSLTILDLGSNLIKEWSDVTILGSLLHLTNLNLKGNSLCSKDGYREKVSGPCSQEGLIA
ncbi:L domain-like protein [Basidiobolus meristosporus CBS 931.73]|uniref:L domain-like protein n=1 Tax=Basidiobolus meristosporus CBS 931.73 TaxID=1314790 RepID=A0A1Y1XU42_9FUNG|nr:L domain-like protein [Basidiobolus meristosporus CBS 931.73]|eukprot:ORX89270.1 L domain-like protein [Basidiobolus meristosporus CBS 931.73]